MTTEQELDWVLDRMDELEREFGSKPLTTYKEGEAFGNLMRSLGYHLRITYDKYLYERGIIPWEWIGR